MPADEAPSTRAPGRASRRRSPRSTPRERELVALKFFAGLSNAEIATVIGIERVERRHPAAPGDREAEEGLR